MRKNSAPGLRVAPATGSSSSGQFPVIGDHDDIVPHYPTVMLLIVVVNLMSVFMREKTIFLTDTAGH